MTQVAENESVAAVPAAKKESAHAAEAKRKGSDFYVGGVPEEFEWVIDQISDFLGPNVKVLDVATGHGGLARMLSKHVDEITGLDSEDSALEQAKKECESFANINFKKGDAENLPFDDQTFDIVACRFAMHQFPYPEDVLEEMMRVCKKDGKVIIMDVVAPDMPKTAANYNIMAKVWDDNVAVARTTHDLTSMAKTAGLTDCKVIRKEVPQQLETWLRRGSGSENRRASIRDAVIQEFEGGRSTGLRPFIDGNDVCCVHSHVCIIGGRQ